MRILPASLLAIGLATASPALAAERSAESGSPVGTRSFTPEDFAVFAPRTALDMVRQIPGFSINEGDGGARGLGQADQNILLNGQRVSGKSNDAVTALSRIEASSVIRIELLEGASLDIPGLSGEVANIVFKSNRFSGTWEWRPEIRERLEDNWLAGEVSLSGNIDGWDWNASFANDAFRRGNFGLETVTDRDGNVLLTRDELSTFYRDRPGLTLGVARITENGNIFNFNAAGELSFFDRVESGTEIDALANEFDRLSQRLEDEWNIELGGDYEFGLAGGRLKLIGLYRFEHSPVDNIFTLTQRIDGGIPEGSRFSQEIDESELIGRAEYGWSAGPADWQVSIEGAFNRLDREAQLFVRDEFGDEVLSDFNGDATVDEKRVEGFLSYSRDLGDGLALQANLGGEFSQLSAGGANAEPRQFVRPKGSVALNWTASGALTISARLARSVDQLSFFDFLASVDVTDDLDRDDNLELVPPQRWEAEFEIIKDIGDWGSIRPFARAAIIEDVIETIPIGPDSEALGNIDSARIWSVGSEGTLLLDPIGWNGARIDFEAAFSGSAIEDPLTGATRELSGRELIDVEAALRHDIPGTNWAWGGEIGYRETAREVRLGNIDLRYDTRPGVSLFIENKDVLGLTARLDIGNLLDSRDGFERLLWDARRDGDFDQREFRERMFGRTIAFSLRGTI